jgi:hypothetical protein
MITPVAFETIDNHTYTIFAIINAIMVPSVYFFFPETAYRSLEEMDTIFAKVSGFGGAFSVVKVAREEPRRYGKNGELLIAVEDALTADKANAANNTGSDDGGVLATDEERNVHP